jgi:cytochrome c-type biogenesis protein CcmH/NrfG
MKGDEDGARNVYLETTKLDPKNADAHYLLSSTMEKLGDRQGAKAELSTFIDLAPSADPRVAAAREKLKGL